MPSDKPADLYKCHGCNKVYCENHADQHTILTKDVHVVDLFPFHATSSKFILKQCGVCQQIEQTEKDKQRSISITVPQRKAGLVAIIPQGSHVQAIQLDSNDNLEQIIMRDGYVIQAHRCGINCHLEMGDQLSVQEERTAGGRRYTLLLQRYGEAMEPIHTHFVDNEGVTLNDQAVPARQYMETLSATENQPILSQDRTESLRRTINEPRSEATVTNQMVRQALVDCQRKYGMYPINIQMTPEEWASLLASLQDSELTSYDPANNRAYEVPVVLSRLTFAGWYAALFPQADGAPVVP